MDVIVRNIIPTHNYKFDIHFPWILSTICLKLTSMHTIAGEFSLIRKLTQECHNYKETCLSGGVYRHEPLLHKAKTNQMKKQTNEQTVKSRQLCNLLHGLTSRDRKRSECKLGKTQSCCQQKSMDVPGNIFFISPSSSSDACRQGLMCAFVTRTPFCSLTSYPGSFS